MRIAPQGTKGLLDEGHIDTNACLDALSGSSLEGTMQNQARWNVRILAILIGVILAAFLVTSLGCPGSYTPEHFLSYWETLIKLLGLFAAAFALYKLSLIHI